jgi:hypothetical protein
LLDNFVRLTFLKEEPILLQIFHKINHEFFSKKNHC